MKDENDRLKVNLPVVSPHISAIHYKMDPIMIQYNSQICGIIYKSYFDEEKTSWASRRRNELIWKLKQNRAKLNKWKVAGLLIPSCLIILGIVCGISFLCNNQVLGLLLGYVGAQGMLLMYYVWTDMFECDPNSVKVKHKGKCVENT